MRHILRFQLPNLSRASNGSCLVSHRNSAQFLTELHCLSSSRNPPSLPALLRLGRRQAASAAGATASIHAGYRILDTALSSLGDTNFNGLAKERKAMLRMLSVCTGWNLVKKTKQLPHTGSHRSTNGKVQERKGVRNEDENWVIEDTETSAARSSMEAHVVSSSRAGKISFNGKASSEKQWDDEIPADDTKFLASIRTRYNFVRVLEIAKTADHPMAGARVLLLDKFGNVHSLYHDYRLLTDSYYDVFPSLPAIIPDGPIGIFGLAAGTAARLIHHFWPEVDMYGWELDPAVVYVARKYFHLEELECSEAPENVEQEVRQGFMGPGSYRKWRKTNDSVFMESVDVYHPKGRLRVLVGDALSPDASLQDGFAGIIVDLFADGAVIPALQEPGVWREMKKKLRPGGRIMVNCGGSCVDAGLGSKGGRVTMEETIAAIAQEFPQQVSILSLRCRGDNHIALTGPLPDLEAWSQALPGCLRIGCDDWVTFGMKISLK